MNTSFDIYELNNAVLDAAKTIKDMRNDFTVDSKDAVVDLVTNADLKSEEILIEAITKYFPEDGIISEESDEVLSSNGRSWLIDPLDGTVNYANNIPQVAITLTLLINKVPEQTYVYDIFQDDLYEGYTDKGAYKNSEKLQVTKETSIQKAIIATGFPYDRLEFGEQYIQTFLSILKTTGGVRRFGSAALDVCGVADNKFDAYYEFFIKPWDTLGASLILKEAGGLVVDEHEAFPTLSSNLIIATNKSIHDDFKSLVLNNIDSDLKERFS